MYFIKRLPDGAKACDLSFFNPANIIGPYGALDTAEIAYYRWDETGYRPRAFARAGWNADGIGVLMWAYEKDIFSTRTEIASDVYRDSCLEFFLMPLPQSDSRYVNIECNTLAAVLLGIGEGRAGRRIFKALPAGLKPQVRVCEGEWWALSYWIGISFLDSEFPGLALRPGLCMRGNFYKCSQDVNEHYGMWADTMSLRPDFHRPEAFGEMGVVG